MKEKLKLSYEESIKTILKNIEETKELKLEVDFYNTSSFTRYKDDTYKITIGLDTDKRKGFNLAYRNIKKYLDKYFYFKPDYVIAILIHEIGHFIHYKYHNKDYTLSSKKYLGNARYTSFYIKQDIEVKANEYGSKFLYDNYNKFNKYLGLNLVPRKIIKWKLWINT